MEPKLVEDDDDVEFSDVSLECICFCCFSVKVVHDPNNGFQQEEEMAPPGSAKETGEALFSPSVKRKVVAKANDKREKIFLLRGKRKQNNQNKRSISRFSSTTTGTEESLKKENLTITSFEHPKRSSVFLSLLDPFFFS
jgi:hypothetical protein